MSYFHVAKQDRLLKIANSTNESVVTDVVLHGPSGQRSYNQDQPWILDITK